MGRIYPDNYHAFNFSAERFGIVHRIRRRLESYRLLKWCRGISEDARLLDVGCGDGFHLKLLRDFGPSRWRLVGIDMDERAVRQAASEGIDVSRGSVEKFPQGPLFEMAFLIMTIEHLAAPVETLRAIRDHLKPGGKLIIVTDNANSPDFHLFKGRHWGGYHFPRHLHLFNRETLEKTAGAAGFDFVSITTGLSPVNWVYSIRNLLSDWHCPSWVVNRFSLSAPLALTFFTLLDAPFSMIGKGAVLHGVFVKPTSEEEQT